MRSFKADEILQRQPKNAKAMFSLAKIESFKSFNLSIRTLARVCGSLSAHTLVERLKDLKDLSLSFYFRDLASRGGAESILNDLKDFHPGQMQFGRRSDGIARIPSGSGGHSVPGRTLHPPLPPRPRGGARDRPRRPTRTRA